MEKEWRVAWIMSVFTSICLFLYIIDWLFFIAGLLLLFVIPATIFQLSKAVIISIRERKISRLYPIATLILFVCLLVFYYFDEGAFSGHKVFSAHFIDDLSRVDLTLWENGKFRAESGYMFGVDTFEGNYLYRNGEITFDRYPIGNDFIPKNLKITNDKIYFRTDYSFYYFKITSNDLSR